MVDDANLCLSLDAHGQSLLPAVEIVLGEAIGGGTFSCGPSTMFAPGQIPEDAPRAGCLLTHVGQLTPPRNDAISLGWFLPPAIQAKLLAAAGSEDELPAKLDSLAAELADVLATDKYRLVNSTSQVSDDMLGDYLHGELPPFVAWQKYTIEGIGDEPVDCYLAWPKSALERMFGPVEAPAPTPAAAPAAPAKPAPRSVAPPKPIPDRVRRLLKMEVPIIVTLASKSEKAAKLLQLGPGSIIEFDQNCADPLLLSVNNLPVGTGEAVKVGEHFGLKVLQILPAEDRLDQLNTRSAR